MNPPPATSELNSIRTRSVCSRELNQERIDLSLSNRELSFPSGPALVPAIHVFLAGSARTWMPGIADKSTQSAQSRLRWPGMTSFTISKTVRRPNLTGRLQRRGKLFGPVPLGHVDDGLHRCREFVNVTHIGKVPLRYATKRLRCDAV